jgi:hypothetical protein
MTGQASAGGPAWVTSEQCLPTDIDHLHRELRRAASARGLGVDALGEVGAWPILLLRPLDGAASRPWLLIAAGFHGEEPAGCWGILHFLKQAPTGLFQLANLSFLPVVNPTGFRLDRRRNDWGENPNQGFCAASVHQLQPSREGAILVAHLPRLKRLADDAFVSLHEDVEQETFYLFTFERSAEPGPFTRALYQAERRFFEPHPDGILEDYSMKGGLVYRACDGTFEDRLFHEGIPRTACTETPGRLDLDLRIEANAAIITALAEWAQDPTGL